MTYNVPSVSIGNPPGHEKLRDFLAEAQAEYMAAGGAITVVAELDCNQNPSAPKLVPRPLFSHRANINAQERARTMRDRLAPKVMELYSAGVSATEISQKVGVSWKTVVRIIKESSKNN